ncbi:MAG TPA: porphobilinogen synthase [Gaiellales bacterium]|jgi:porphobilinogen synthase|nr:porphobilinogen synthase [Gaiellales bacterium]
MGFPATRMRRLRRTGTLRSMVRETRLAPADFIAPLFVRHGAGVREPIPSLAGQHHLSVDMLVEEARELHGLGVPAVILFGLPDEKDEAALEAYAEDGIVQQALRALRAELPGLTLITDVCLCQYTSHGHCGVLRDGAVDNDITLELLSQTAVSHAVAGADVVAPSDMMDGRVAAIRSALDDEGLTDTAIMAYSAKFASAFYGPFRDAAHSTPSEGDRRGYQMDPANLREALREVELDVAEGADVVMVKPAMPYLDVIRRVRDRTDLPIAAYQVSGEYAMLEAAVAAGLLDRREAALEALTSIKRAGADLIITYHASRAAKWLS